MTQEKEKLSPKTVHQIRTRLRLTQTELAEKVGVSQPTVAMWESGVRKPSGPATKLLKQIADERISTKK